MSAFDANLEASPDVPDFTSQYPFQRVKEFPASEFLDLCVKYPILEAHNFLGFLSRFDEIVSSAFGLPELERAIFDAPPSVVNALQELVQWYLNSGDLRNARRTVRLLVKAVAKGAPLPSSMFTNQFNIQLHDRDPQFQGGFSDIFCATTVSGSRIALKRIRVTQIRAHRQDFVRRIYKEALIWCQLNHPYILPFYGVDTRTFPSYPTLVSPWMAEGTLLDFVVKARQSTEVLSHMVLCVARGLHYLHEFGIVHGDVKAANVFMSDDGLPLLADFGLAGLGDTASVAAATTTNQDGSIRWCAPELLNSDPTKHKRTRASDAYAFGSLVLEAFTGQSPFSGINNNFAVLPLIIQGVLPIKARPEHMPIPTWNIICGCWSTDASYRPSLEHIINVLSSLETTKGSPFETLTQDVHSLTLQKNGVVITLGNKIYYDAGVGFGWIEIGNLNSEVAPK